MPDSEIAVNIKTVGDSRGADTVADSLKKVEAVTRTTTTTTNTLTEAQKTVGKTGTDTGYRLQVLGQAFQDAQYGAGALANQAGQLSQVLGLGAGVGGVALIAATAVQVLTGNFDLFGRKAEENTKKLDDAARAAAEKARQSLQAADAEAQHAAAIEASNRALDAAKSKYDALAASIAAARAEREADERIRSDENRAFTGQRLAEIDRDLESGTITRQEAEKRRRDIKGLEEQGDHNARAAEITRQRDDAEKKAKAQRDVERLARDRAQSARKAAGDILKPEQRKKLEDEIANEDAEIAKLDDEEKQRLASVDDFFDSDEDVQRRIVQKNAIALVRQKRLERRKALQGQVDADNANRKGRFTSKDEAEKEAEKQEAEEKKAEQEAAAFEAEARRLERSRESAEKVFQSTRETRGMESATRISGFDRDDKEKADREKEQQERKAEREREKQERASREANKVSRGDLAELSRVFERVRPQNGGEEVSLKEVMAVMHNFAARLSKPGESPVSRQEFERFKSQVEGMRNSMRNGN